MKNIHFVRHGQSEHNLLKKYCGQIDSPLTEQGLKDAYNVGLILSDKNITHIISSPLVRAHDTAKEIQRLIDPKGFLSIHTTPLIQEVYLGNIQDKEYFAETNGLICATQKGTGEAIGDLYKRAVQAINLIMNTETLGDTLVVGHWLFSSIIFAVLEGKTKDEFIEYQDRFLFSNGEVKTISLE